MAAPVQSSATTSDPVAPKTLIVDLSQKYGGSTSRVLSLMTRLPKESIALAGLESAAVTREALQLGLPVRVVGQGKADPLIVRNLMRVIRGEGFQVLDSQNIQSKFYASIASTLTGTALVSTINSWYANEHGKSSTKGQIYTALELATNWNLAVYICVSEKDRQALLRAGIHENKIELIYNAVEINSDTNADKDWLRRKLNLKSHSFLCTAVGRLVRIKGFDILIEAAQQACAEIPELIFVIIGEGEARDELNAQIQRAGLHERVILTGHFDRPSVMKALQASDMFVMPSRYEGTPIALLEAAALGRAIVASNAGGIPEMVTNGEHALLAPPENPQALANEILKICTDSALAKRLGHNAQKRVREKFTLDIQASATQRAYQKAWLMKRGLEK